VRHLALRVITMMLIGVVIGPLVGIYIAEYWSGSEDSLGFVRGSRLVH
jgi:ABC-type phosphate transport system permease subunit